MFSDAHLHLADLESRDPEFPKALPGPDWLGAAVSHDADEFELSRQLATRLPGCLLGFGIHPQGVRDDTAELLAFLARNGKIDFIGEAGFDFFGDRPERIRTPKTLAAQKKAFEFQLTLAAGCGLPLVIHARKGLDLLLAYTKSLSTLPSVIFHGWPGRASEAELFINRGVKAYFSFGTPLLRGAKHAEESIAFLGPDRLLSETDAPWQPPFGQPWTALSALDPIAARIAQVKGIARKNMDHRLRLNFLGAFKPGKQD
ncbi:MAG: TatD DNase family protein [Spirochaetes bacterium]|nr:MAG: TatD DNase family protein [Spirochaetota bacterium]